jgi:uncharacterized membrane protein YbhN (UPF0104 family)
MSVRESGPELALRRPTGSFVVWVLRLVLSLGLFWYILSRIALADLVRALTRADWVCVLLGVALLPLGLYLAALQMKAVVNARGMQLTIGELVQINLATSFYGLFLPGYLAGGGVRWYKLMRTQRRPIDALNALVYNRLVDSAVVLAVGMCFWALDGRTGASSAVPWVFGGMLVLIGAAGSVMTAAWNRPWLHRLRLAQSLGASRDRVPPVQSPGSDSASGLALSEGGALVLARVMVLAVARHVAGITAVYLFALSIRLPLGFASVGWVRTLLAMVGILPVSFGGLGVREASLVGVLQPYGVSAADAVALGLLLFGRDLLAALAGAALEARAFLAPAPSKRLSQT